MKRICSAMVAAVLVVTLTGCGGDDTGKPNGNPTAPYTKLDDGGGTLTVVHVTVDGRAVPCIVYDRTNGVGLSCDWGVR